MSVQPAQGEAYANTHLAHVQAEHCAPAFKFRAEVVVTEVAI
jgi:hypothetical protein